jgi:hypothetical protein
MNSPQKNLKAITDFSKDFTKFQVDNLSLISSVATKLSPALSAVSLDDYFMERVSELFEDLYSIAAEDKPKEQQIQIRGICHEWVSQHMRNASNMTLVALTLWLDGAEDGRAALFAEAGIADAGNAAVASLSN